MFNKKVAPTGSDQITVTTTVTFGPGYLAGQGENIRKFVRAIPGLFRDGRNSVLECMEIAAELDGDTKTRSEEIARLRRDIAVLKTAIKKELAE